MKYPPAPLSPFPPTFPNQSRLRMPCLNIKFALSSPTERHRFANPFLPSPYELLFRQPLCFLMYLRCPLFFQKLESKLFANLGAFNLQPPQVPLRHPVTTLCGPQKSQLLCNQANPNSFAKYRGWGCPPTFNFRLSTSASVQTSGPERLTARAAADLCAQTGEPRKREPKIRLAPAPRSWSTQ